MRILIHVRPYSDKFFTSVARSVFGNGCQIDTISEFRGCGDYWEGDFSLNSKMDRVIEDDLLRDIVSRDRYLRSISKSEADRVVRRFWNGVEQLFFANQYDYVLLHPIDCHVQDICERIARKYGAIPISFVGSFLEGYAKFTLRGEGVVVRDCVDANEVDSVVSALRSKYYLPPSESKNVTQNRRSAYSYYLRRRLIETLYNPVLRVLKRDWDNQQYGTKLVGANRYRDLMPRDYDSLFITSEEVEFCQNNIYLPLHYTPEQTTDYFCKHIARVGYENYITSIIEKADTDCIFLIKEHPAMYGKRNIGFYKELRHHRNVRLVHPLSSSNNLLDKVNNVLIDNGTVGVEALIRGKRVLALESNYYSGLHPNLHLISQVDSRVLTVPLCDYPDEKFVESLLKQLFPSDLIADKNLNSCDPQTVSNALRGFLARYGS